MRIQIFVSGKLSVLLLMCVASSFQSTNAIYGELEQKVLEAVISIGIVIKGLPKKSTNVPTLIAAQKALMKNNKITEDNIKLVKTHVDTAIEKGCFFLVMLRLQATLQDRIDKLENNN